MPFALVFKDSAASLKAWESRHRALGMDELRANMQADSKHVRTAAAFFLKTKMKDHLTDYDRTRIEEIRREGIPAYYGKAKKEETVIASALGFEDQLR